MPIRVTKNAMAGVIIIATVSMLFRPCGHGSMGAAEPEAKQRLRSEVDWNGLPDFSDVSLLDELAARYPNTAEGDAAIALRYVYLKNELDRVCGLTTWDEKAAEELIRAYHLFLKQYESKALATRAMFDLYDLCVRTCGRANSVKIAPLAEFIERYPDDMLAVPALRQLQQIAYDKTLEVLKGMEKPTLRKRLELLDEYLSRFPDAPQAADMQVRAISEQVKVDKENYDKAVAAGDNSPKAVLAVFTESNNLYTDAINFRKSGEFWEAVKCKRQADRKLEGIKSAWPAHHDFASQASARLLQEARHTELIDSISSLKSEMKRIVEEAKFEMLGELRADREKILSEMRSLYADVKAHLVLIESKVDIITVKIDDLQKSMQEVKKSIADLDRSISDMRNMIIKLDNTIKIEVGDIKSRLDAIDSKLDKRRGGPFPNMDEIYKAARTNREVFSKDMGKRIDGAKRSVKKMFGALLPSSKVVVFDFDTGVFASMNLVTGSVHGGIEFDGVSLDLGLLQRVLCGEDVSGQVSAALDIGASLVDLDVKGALQLAARGLLLRVERSDDYQTRREKRLTSDGSCTYCCSRRFATLFGPEVVLKDVAKGVLSGGTTAKADVEKYRSAAAAELADLVVWAQAFAGQEAEALLGEAIDVLTGGASARHDNKWNATAGTFPVAYRYRLVAGGSGFPERLLELIKQRDLSLAKVSVDHPCLFVTISKTTPPKWLDRVKDLESIRTQFAKTGSDIVPRLGADRWTQIAAVVWPAASKAFGEKIDFTSSFKPDTLAKLQASIGITPEAMGRLEQPTLASLAAGQPINLASGNPDDKLHPGNKLKQLLLQLGVGKDREVRLDYFEFDPATFRIEFRATIRNRHVWDMAEILKRAGQMPTAIRDFLFPSGLPW